MSRFVVLSGCSGGGKSTLLCELAKRGYGVVAEPGRQIVAQQQSIGGRALPWLDVEAFLNLAMDRSLLDLSEVKARTAGADDTWVFFDRGLVDAASALADVTSSPILSRLPAELTYHRLVFLTPPWPEIYVADAERQHPLEDAIREYERLLVDYPLLGYEVVILPKTSIAARADFVLQQLSL